MTASQVVPCGSDSFHKATSNYPSPESQPLQSSLLPSTNSASVLIPDLVWPDAPSMDNQQQNQHQQQPQQQQYLKKVTLVPDPLAASVANEEAASAAVAAPTSTTTSSSNSSSTPYDRLVNSSEGYSSASSIDNNNLPLIHVARAGLPPSSATSSILATSAVESSSSAAFVSLSTSAAAANNNNTVAEFLYQLSKMLSDDNRDIIEWSNGKIEVHSPQKLESQVLHKYFRHSKFASFQRQLNYFGFRKMAGKGKMAPCSYINDDTTQDLRSLLLIKRKASLTQSGKEKTKRKRDRRDSDFGSQGSALSTTNGGGAGNQTNQVNHMVNPILAGILHRSSLSLPTSVIGSTTDLSSSCTTAKPPATETANPLKGLIQNPLAIAASTSSAATQALATPQALAQAAVGKGIKHGLRAPLAAPLISGAATNTSTTAQVATIPLSSATTSNPQPASVSTIATTASIPTIAQPPQQQQQMQIRPQESKGELMFLPDAQIPHSIQESLSQLTNNFRNSLNELTEQCDSGDSDGRRSISPGGAGLFMLSRNSSLVDLAMLDVQHDVSDGDAEGGDQNAAFLMPFVDFPHQDLIPTGPQQASQEDHSESGQQN